MSRKELAEKSNLHFAPVMQLRRGAGGSLLLRMLDTTIVILFACIFAASVPNPDSNGGINGLCPLHNTSPAHINRVQPPPEEVGLQVGQRAPSFRLKDQNGADTSLQALIQKGVVVLVFYRSADWCHYCKQQLADLQRNLKEIEAGGK